MASAPQPLAFTKSDRRGNNTGGPVHTHPLDASAAAAAAAVAAVSAAEVRNQDNAQTNSALQVPFSTGASTGADLTRPAAGSATSTTATTATTSTSSTTSTTSSAAPSAAEIHFRSNTIAPTPPPSALASDGQDLPDNSSDAAKAGPSPFSDTPRPASRLQIDCQMMSHRAGHLGSDKTTPHLRPQTSASSLKPLCRTPSLKTGRLPNLASVSAASSRVSSPIISAMGDMTPLPSPLLASDSPGPWRNVVAGRRTSSDDATVALSGEHALVTSAGESIEAALANQGKRKTYASLSPGSGLDVPKDGKMANGGNEHGHARNRSISDYVPDPMVVPRRMATVTGASHSKVDKKASGEACSTGHMRREPHLSGARGLTPVEKPPTPPPSESSLSATESSCQTNGSSSNGPTAHECFVAFGRLDRKRRRWRAIKTLGQGTFSRVMLATSHISPGRPAQDVSACDADGRLRHDRRALVAVKVCEHGPQGGASEDRIEMSLKRELEIMNSIRHPCLVDLKAWNIEPTRAILVLSYCPGGDLFDVASAHGDTLNPTLLRRMFAELVGAVSYLHDRNIVHRDIKLENVLVNLSPADLRSTTIDWATYPYSVITLTDLGLSRRVADNEKLETRCGSDDYAAPEVIMGQAYDGRATDAWSLGVLLYALLESRLPFDPPPGIGDPAMQVRMRSRTSHRIARVEWRWIGYGVRDGEEGAGDHEADLARFDAKGLRGAMEVVEGLLKRARSRWPLAKVAGTDWVSGGIQVDGGIRFREEEEGEEVM